MYTRTHMQTRVHTQLTPAWQWLAHLLSRQSWELNGPRPEGEGQLRASGMHTHLSIHTRAHMCVHTYAQEDGYEA